MNGKKQVWEYGSVRVWLGSLVFLIPFKILHFLVFSGKGLRRGY